MAFSRPTYPIFLFNYAEHSLWGRCSTKMEPANANHYNEITPFPVELFCF